MNEDELEELTERHEREEIWNQVRAAFESRDRPSEPLVYEIHPLAEDVQCVLSGKTWEDVTAHDLQQIRLDLHFLRPEAFWYYFLAIAWHALVGEEPVDDPAGWTVVVLTPRESQDVQLLDRFVASLSREERSAVSRFIRWHSDEESYLPNRENLLEFWSR
ncbi:DUF6714 family protein [Actinomadura violacea]|uniref:Uncharacterized protein n=1 Tax=Actinomadura violacea TaxID=2819934 RepID=A0ABS3RN57_9ACTN|nr:DUF6714 family protein [Actinomadura violacea]MBO2458157.1 hypothetical protein [Actinomadura violacea]